MSLKSFFVFLFAVILMGIFVLKYYAEYLYVILFLVFILGLAGEYLAGKAKRNKNNSPIKKSSNFEEKDTEEYHNDFSKVPAGTATNAQSFLEEHPYDNKDVDDKAKKKNTLDV